VLKSGRDLRLTTLSDLRAWKCSISTGLVEVQFLDFSRISNVLLKIKYLSWAWKNNMKLLTFPEFQGP